MPQGLGLGVSLLTAPAVSSVFGSQRIFRPFFWCSVLPPCLVVMSCVSLQFSSRRWLRLRTPSRSASPGSWAPLALVGPQPPPPAARPQPPQPPQRPRRRPRPATRPQRLCCAQRPSRQPPPGLALAPVPLRRCPNVHRGAVPAPEAVALAESGLVTGLAPSVAHWSLLLSCASPASPALSTLLQSPRRHLATLPGLVHPQPRPPRPPVLRRLRPTPMMTGTLSSMHMASPRLPVALRPPSLSRPTPLELVGAPATSAAAVCARPPSALCGGRSDVLSPVLCTLSAGEASSCGCVCFSVGAGLLFRWRREADFGGLLRFLPPVLCGARLSLRVGSVLWGMSTAPLVFDVLLGDATLAYTCGAPCLARDCPGGFCPLSRGSCPLAPLLCESSRASDLTLRASLAWAFVARFPRSRGVGLHV